MFRSGSGTLSSGSLDSSLTVAGTLDVDDVDDVVDGLNENGEAAALNTELVCFVSVTN